MQQARPVYLLSFSLIPIFVTQWTAVCQDSLPFTNLLKLAQTHAHCVNDTIQPSPPLSSPSPALNLF